MALNIPLPGAPGENLLKGIDTGSSMFARLMHPILAREQQAQAERHFQEELKLRKAAAGRAGANSDLQRQIMQQQLLAAQHRNDPMYEFNQYKALQDMITDGGAAGQPGGQIQNEPAPTEELGQGMGMFSPEGLQEVEQQQAPHANNPNNVGMDLEVFKKSPMLRGFFKHKFGVDPLAQTPQTPEEKEAMAIDLYKKKEAIKAANGGTLPAAVKTLHENIIQLSPKAHKAIQHIIDIPSPLEPWGFGAIQSGQKAAHHAAIKAAAENYAKAKGWPNTKGSIQKVEEILQRGKFETDLDYRKRLKGYQDELDEGVELSNQFLHPEKALSKTNNNVIEYERVNGRLVPKKR